MHVVFRLSSEPLRLSENGEERSIGIAVVGGARSSYYVKDMSSPSISVGAQLRPGASELLFGASAEELSERHTPLEDLWGPEAGRTREQLLDIAGPERRIELLESVLARRLPVVRGLHPAIAAALDRFEGTESVRDLVKESGYSHRHFLSLFRRAVGLSPKIYGRVLRFRRALRQAASGSPEPWASIALDAGYSDQAHFNRDFLEFAGVTPSAYRKAAPLFPHHVRVD